MTWGREKRKLFPVLLFSPYFFCCDFTLKNKFKFN